MFLSYSPDLLLDLGSEDDVTVKRVDFDDSGDSRIRGLVISD
jgi:hypothetical protein